MKKTRILFFIVLSGFILWGCKYPYKENQRRDSRFYADQEGSFSEDIKNYLINMIGCSDFKGKIFCDYYEFGREEQDGKITKYMWVLCQEYFLENEDLRTGSEVCLPVSLILDKKLNCYRVLDLKCPIPSLNSSSSTTFDKEVKDIFPKKYYDKIFINRSNYPEFISKKRYLEFETEKEAKIYYGIIK